MGETLYRKVGRRYEPIAWYEEIDTYYPGAWLVVVTPKERSKNYQFIKVESGMDVESVAAKARFKTLLADCISEAQRPSVSFDRCRAPETTPLTDEQLAALDECKRVFGDRPVSISHPSLQDVVDNAVDLMMERDCE